MTTWRDEAACRHLDPEQFFPESGYPPQKIVDICNACPVQKECFQYAVDMPGPADMVTGIWGGKPAIQVIAKRRQNPRPRWNPTLKPCGTPAAKRRHHRNGEPLCPQCANTPDYRKEPA